MDTPNSGQLGQGHKSLEKRLRAVALIIALSGVACMILAPAIAAQDPGISDTLRVGSVQGLKGGRVSVPVYMFNDEILGGLTLVLKYDALALTLDTFLFDGGVAADFTGQVVSIDRVAGVLQAAVFSFDTSLIAPGTGLVGTLRFSVNQNTPQGAYIIDTTSVTVGPGAVNQTVFSPFAGSGSVFPQFSAGTISVPEFQATSDSIGAGSAIGAQGQSVQIDFVLFNETPLVSIRLPFTYSSSHLLFDSISYAGTRGALSVSSQTQHNADSLQVLISLDYFDTAPLAPDSSSIAKAFFTISAGAPNGVIPVDTASFLSLVPLRVTTSVAAGDFTFTPLFGPGEITVDITTDVDDGGGPLLPLEFGLDQNFPNPFNPTTTIRFSLARSAHARLTVFNMLGQSVADLVDRRLEAGEHSITFDASRGANFTLASGVYFYRLEVSGRTLTRKMALVK